MGACVAEGASVEADSSLSSYYSDQCPSSPLSSVRSVSPPPDGFYFESSQARILDRLTPSSSQDGFGNSQRSDGDGNAPKRRKLNNHMPRETFHVDLDDTSEEAQARQAPHLARLKKALATKRKIVVIAGAGISVSAGIPDFRSSTGLFKSLKAEHNLKGSGKHLFDAAVYQDDTSTETFHDMVRSMSELTKAAKPTPFHQLLGRLAHEKRLLRLYTQNIDGLDTSIEPLRTEVPLPKKGPWPKTVQLHGSLDKMSCSKCHRVSDFQSQFFEESTPVECQECAELDEAREVAGKRSHGVGRLRPRMVLYHEHNPDDEAIGAVTKADLRARPDAVIVVGTSLKIPGVRRIVREMCGIVRDRRDGLTVWLNSDAPPARKEFENCWDLVVKGAADEVAEKASLGRFDDPEVIVDFVSEDSAAKAKEKSNPQVILETPPKVSRPKGAESLPTPAMSPRPAQHFVKSIKLNLSKLAGPSTESKAPSEGPPKSIKQFPVTMKKAAVIQSKPKPKSTKPSADPSKAAAASKPTKPRAKKAIKPTTQIPSIATFAKTSKPSLKNPSVVDPTKENPADQLPISKKRSSPHKGPETPTKRHASATGPVELSAGSPKVNVSPVKFPNLKMV
ncbi:MAG: hypothetical protein M1828_004497 [Chrysothrix sp. TS-e1954]|nr:MAG: hypothetical protein M1828_004497 [Chrysothrix sp. TS-e1954]